MSKITSLYLY